MIIKAQRALNADTVLIYDKRRKVSGEIPFDGAIKIAIGDKDKAYFEATIDNSGTLSLRREVFGQNW